MLGIRHHGPGSRPVAWRAPRRARARPASWSRGRPRPTRSLARWPIREHAAAGRRCSSTPSTSRGARVVLPVRRVLARSGWRCAGRSTTASRCASSTCRRRTSSRSTGEPERPARRPSPSATRRAADARSGDPLGGWPRPPATTTPSAGGRTPSSTATRRRRSSASRRSPRRWPRSARPTTRPDDADARDARARGGHAPGAPRRDAGGPRADRRRVRRLARAGARPGHVPAAAATTTALLTGLPKARSRPPGCRGPRPAGRGAAATAPGHSPGWYQHLFDHGAGRRARSRRWLVRGRRACCATSSSTLHRPRRRGGPAGRRPGRAARPALAGLAELNDATQAVLCDGAELPLRLDRRRAGRRRRARRRCPTTPRWCRWPPTWPRTQRACGCKPTRRRADLELDLRRAATAGPVGAAPPARGCSACLGHAEIDGGAHDGHVQGGVGARVASPSSRSPLIEASVSAPRSRRRPATVRRAADERRRPRRALAALLEALPARRPARRRCATVVAALAERTARQHDVARLLAALPSRWRGRCATATCAATDVGGVGARARRRSWSGPAVGLPAACTALDDDAADAMRDAIEAAAPRRRSARRRRRSRATWRERAGRGRRPRRRARLGGRPGRPAAARRGRDRRRPRRPRG